MPKIVDLSKEQDLPGCVSAPLFLSELMRCLSEDVKKPAADMLQIFAEMAQYAAKKDDPRLNVLCLRLGLFKMPPDKLKEALESEMERIRHPQNKDQEERELRIAAQKAKAAAEGRESAMTKPLIALPCTAQEMEDALHAVCDQGLWDVKVHAEEVFEPIANAQPYVGSRTYVAGKAYKRVTRLVIETETKGNANEQPDSVAKG